MLSIYLVTLCLVSVLGEVDETTTVITTTQPATISTTEEHDHQNTELQTEESRVLKEPENTTLPVNHSGTLRAMPTEQTKIHGSQSQTQAHVHPHFKIAPESVLNISAVTDVGKLKNFRPSPQLETIFEYNRIPVEPAFPEAKTFQGTSIKIPVHSTLSHVIGTANDAEDKDRDIWTSNVRFPHTHPVTVNDHPYPYLKDGIDKGSGFSGFGSYNGYSSFGNQGGFQTVTEKKPPNPKAFWNDGWDKSLKRKPPSKSYIEHSSSGSGLSSFNTNLSSSPWKKIIKILTAFIPIGLLLSALTPSIITIGPMNSTMMTKARSEDRNKGFLSQLALDGCDDRVFCELMLSAEETGKADKNIEAMLENFLQRCV